ncbi:WD40 repeat-like protein [Obba rivulosa]|uniref:WD40 repeat-like protein n=1 Tax=Obba rivulosa TaxID=1052685 RepID=A0A8E2AHX1_9APHY|nr:WD40 repeat-like protein [Obba rivulosa]
MSDEPSSTLYMPIVSPPTPAPSPRPAHSPLVAPLSFSSPNDPICLARQDFASLDPTTRRLFLSVILEDCTPQELLFVSTKIAPLLKRDFLRDLPPEVALHIISFLDDPQTLARASRVSRHWNRLLADDWIWRRLCHIHGFSSGEEPYSNEEQRSVQEDIQDDEDVANMLIPPSPSPPSSVIGFHKHSIRHSIASSLALSTFGASITQPGPLPRLSSYEQFRYQYTTTKNWLHGGRILRIHRVPLLSHHLPLPQGPNPMPAALPPPSTAIPTSIALDSVWLVVGLANSRILVFSARTGVLSRTLVGHDSGVWAVALIKGGGEGAAEAEDAAMDVDSPDPGNSPSSGEGSQRHRPSHAQGASTSEGDPGLEHLIPSTIRQGIGLDRPPATPKRVIRASDIFRSPRRKAKNDSGRPAHPEKPSDPAGASDGWGQSNALVVSGGCDKELRVWDVKSGYCIYTLRGHTSTIRCLKVLHGRPIAVSGSRDKTVRVWDVQRGRLLRVLVGHEQSVRCLDVYGNRVVSGSYDCTCRVWDVDTGECLHVLSGHFHQIYSVAFDGIRIASGGLDTTVRVWDADTGVCLALLQGHTALVCQLQLSPTMLATGGSDGRVITFSLGASFGVVQRLAAHDSSVTGLQLDERFLVTGGNDGRVRLFQFDRATGKCEYVRELSEPSESVWKVVYTRETLAVMCKRAGKTVMEIWSFKPDALS